mmetsp:Transcript_36917/g.86905  ORF Transcript_36917/g.86905 Transcript_36917/m.86905 type:complete len:225 (-) Transcript_36917:127-801(-)
MMWVVVRPRGEVREALAGLDADHARVRTEQPRVRIQSPRVRTRRRVPGAPIRTRVPRAGTVQGSRPEVLADRLRDVTGRILGPVTRLILGVVTSVDMYHGEAEGVREGDRGRGIGAPERNGRRRRGVHLRGRSAISEMRGDCRGAGSEHVPRVRREDHEGGQRGHDTGSRPVRAELRIVRAVPTVLPAVTLGVSKVTAVAIRRPPVAVGLFNPPARLGLGELQR